MLRNLILRLADLAALGSRKEFSSALKTDTTAAAFTPPGKVIHRYSISGEEYQVWCSSLTDPRAQDMMRNAQILMPLFIEGAQEINLDDADENVFGRWKIYLLYKIVPPPINDQRHPTISKYSLVGYSTSYRLWYLAPNRTAKPTFPPDYSFPADDLSSSITSSLPNPPSTKDSSDPLYNTIADIDTPVRERISQFLILPPFRGTAHGTQLYTAMVSLFLGDPSCFEITVEDPNEAFDDLRDYSDLSRMLNNAANPTRLADSALSAEFQSLKIDDKGGKEAVLKLPKKNQDAVPLESLVNMQLWNRTHRASKIHHREFDRLVEMHLLKSIPLSHRSASRIAYKHNAPQAKDREYYFWRCLVKERLRIHNRDSLADLEADERDERLNDAVTNVQHDYERILDTVRRRAEKAAMVAVEEVQAVEASETGRKRKIARVVMDDDDDDEEEEEEAGIGVVNGNANGNAGGSKKLRIDE